MKTPKQIVISTTNVHSSEVAELIADIANLPFPRGSRGLKYTTRKGQIIISNFDSLYSALQIMTYLEKNCWKWEDIA